MHYSVYSTHRRAAYASTKAAHLVKDDEPADDASSAMLLLLLRTALCTFCNTKPEVQAQVQMINLFVLHGKLATNCKHVAHY
jgi:hypothetical protein